MKFQITVAPDDARVRQQLAKLLVMGFRKHRRAWETLPEAMNSVSTKYNSARLMADQPKNKTPIRGIGF